MPAEAYGFDRCSDPVRICINRIRNNSRKDNDDEEGIMRDEAATVHYYAHKLSFDNF